MLEKIDGEIKNGQSRDTGNNGHRCKTNKIKNTENNTTQKTKKMSNMEPKKKVDMPYII